MDKKVPSKFQFWHFRVLWGKFAKFLMSFSKQHVRFSSNFASLFNVIKMILLYFFRSNNIYFVQKYPIKVKIFEPFWCSGQNLSNSLCQFGNGKSIPLQILYPFLVSWKITPLYLFSSSNIDFAQKETIKVKLFETFECSGQNLSNFLCQFWNDKSILLQILHHSSLSWNISSVDFKLILFLLWIKGSHQNPNFETFKCSGENLPYSSCHFSNHKSVFLQTLHHPLVLWKITPLYFLGQTLNTLANRRKLKCKSWRLASA